MSQPARAIAERFDLLAKLGEGAFAEVYRARDRRDGREVAVKLLRASLRDEPEAIERFRREGLAVAALDSAHVVALYELGHAGDDVFLSMEYVAGPTLRDVLIGEPWPPEAVHAVVGQIAQAAATAHARGIIHRDLKPENLVLVGSDRGRQVKVLDFGLAKLLELERDKVITQLTAQGSSFGTPQYMAPEQLEGAPADVRTDLWAIAVIAYELLTGQLPWDGRDARDVFFAMTTQPRTTLARHHPAVTRTEELQALFARAFARDPEVRPADATALFAAFEQALFGGPLATTDVFIGVIGAEIEVPRPADFKTISSVQTDETLPGAAR